MYFHKIKTSTIVKYNVAQSRPQIKEESLANLSLKHTATHITSKTKHMYASRIEAFTESIRYTKHLFPKIITGYSIFVSFLTLTLPSTQLDEDKDNKRNLLNKFLIYMQRKHDIKIYAWKAEKQGNGNIHYHIMLDRFVPKEDIRQIWDNILQAKGYKMADTQDVMRKSFSTWVISVNDEAAMKKYICKYMTKEDNYERAGIEGRKMGCSDALRKLSMFTTSDLTIMQKFIGVMMFKTWIKCYEKEYSAVYVIDYELFKKDEYLKNTYTRTSKIQGREHTIYCTTVNTIALIKDYDIKLYEILTNFYSEQIELIYS